MKPPRLLFDENLSPRLVAWLSDVYHGSAHADEVGLHGRTDREVWEWAREKGFMLVSKDNDFRQLSFFYGPPPKVVWRRIGNAPTRAVSELLRAQRKSFFALPRKKKPRSRS